jgi:hypothetical protein
MELRSDVKIRRCVNMQMKVRDNLKENRLSVGFYSAQPTIGSIGLKITNQQTRNPQ